MNASATLEQGTAVREIENGDVTGLASMMARSFATCPAWQWYLPPEARRRQEWMERFFVFLIGRIYLAGGRGCWTTEDRAAALLWDRPGEWRIRAGDTARMLVVMAGVFGRTLPRALRGFSAWDAGHPDRPHYFLSALGAARETRRIGAAEGLMSPLLERCDAESMPAYAETGRPGSRDFFVVNGFDVLEEWALPGGGPVVWRMWREPRR